MGFYDETGAELVDRLAVDGGTDTLGPLTV
jgi:hypothetical protein